MWIDLSPAQPTRFRPSAKGSLDLSTRGKPIPSPTLSQTRRSLLKYLSLADNPSLPAHRYRKMTPKPS